MKLSRCLLLLFLVGVSLSATAQVHAAEKPNIDMTDFFMGKTNKSGRESVVVYNGGAVYGVKWRDWKMMIKEIDGMGDLNAPSALPSFYNLLQDPKEMHPLRLAPANLWIRYPASQVLIDHAVSLKKEPPIPEGTPDPYTPNQ